MFNRVHHPGHRSGVKLRILPSGSLLVLAALNLLSLLPLSYLVSRCKHNIFVLYVELSLSRRLLHPFPCTEGELKVVQNPLLQKCTKCDFYSTWCENSGILSKILAVNKDSEFKSIVNVLGLIL